MNISAMPPQYTRSYPSGANSPMTAGIIAQHNQAKLQIALTISERIFSICLSLIFS